VPSNSNKDIEKKHPFIDNNIAVSVKNAVPELNLNNLIFTCHSIAGPL